MKIHESDYADNNFDVRRSGDELHVNITYPGWKDGDEPNRVRHVHVDQESVRASDGLRLTYDYDRDGWSIQQPYWDDGELIDDGLGGHHEGVEHWVETAFVKSWAVDRPTD